jgi:hypothetical protein
MGQVAIKKWSPGLFGVTYVLLSCCLSLIPTGCLYERRCVTPCTSGGTLCLLGSLILDAPKDSTLGTLGIDPDHQGYLGYLG